MKNVFLVAIMSVLVLSCKYGNKPVTNDNKKTEKSEKTEQNSTTQMGDTSKNSLDWAGTYHGIVPCADCEGTDTSITLHDDNTFTISEIFLGKDDNVYNQEGTFKWNKEENKITLSIADAENKRQYLVGENQLFQLDLEGNRVTGETADLFILKKQ